LFYFYLTQSIKKINKKKGYLEIVFIVFLMIPSTHFVSIQNLLNNFLPTKLLFFSIILFQFYLYFN